ncbi:transcriptional repressor [uncultured Croceitalea sp.]|uniref:Fur family transcriptional regulator n=1 Tax=uncultured Croceitalea sp. TaxID=1798908 RepID=UPI00330639E9
MDNQQSEQLLQRKGLKKTKLRHALIQHFIKTQHAQSYADIKQALMEATDKSTLYRNLTAFEHAGLIHSINDYSGVTKYAFGEAPIQGNEHAHFVCECCETVYCMDGLAPLQLDIPKGFRAKRVQTIIRGICADC